MKLHKDTLLAHLRRRIGRENGITAARLVAGLRFYGVDCDERDVRRVVEELRREGHHVCALPGTGYFLARDEAELERCIAFLTSRALCSLTQAAQMRRVSIADLLGQERIRLERPEEQEAPA